MDNLTIDHQGGVAVVTLDRPPVNALNQQAFEEISQAFDQLSGDRDVRVAVLAAAGDRAFCAGVDLNDSPQRYRTDGRRVDGGPQGDPRHQVDPGRLVRDCFWSIYHCSVPVIAALGGKAIGAGAALVASCDLLVASEQGSVALTEINVGVLGGVKHAQRLVGPFLAKRMLLTGEAVSADELYRRGVVEAVVPADQLLPAAVSLAQTIASKSPIAIRLAKESANRVEYLPLQEGYRLEQDYTLRVRRYSDADEARLAFLEKRSPDYHWE
jgi:enoyl-CoA hydratase